MYSARTLAAGFGLFSLAVAASMGSANAQAVGTTVESRTTVTGSGPGGNRVIVDDSPIYSDDRLSADRTGNAQIILVDGTKIVVGPNADLDITDYVYETEARNSFSSLTIRATKGTFRVITGRSNASAFRIDTPSGTIGVRG